MRRGIHPFAPEGRKKNSRRSLAAIRHRNNVKVGLGEDGADAIANRIGHLLRGQRLFEFVRSDEDLHESEIFYGCGTSQENQVVFRPNIGHDWTVENMPLVHHARETPRKRVFLPPFPVFAFAMRLMVGTILLLVFTGAAAETPTDQKASPTPKTTPEPTPIPLAELLPEMQATSTTLEEIDASASRVQSNTDAFVTRLSKLTGELNPRLAEDTKLLSSSPSLDLLYRIKLTWEDFGRHLSGLARELTQQATSLEQELSDLDRLAKTWGDDSRRG